MEPGSLGGFYGQFAQAALAPPPPPPPRGGYRVRPIDGFGVGLCGAAKIGVTSGIKVGPCLNLGWRWTSLFFELETQVFYGGVRKSLDVMLPVSFVVPLTGSSVWEGLHVRGGGSPLGITAANARNGGTYMRFGLHAGVSYEWAFSSAVSWRVFDARAFLDFATKERVDHQGGFLDYGAILASGIVF